MSSSHKYIQSKHGRGWSWRSGYYEIHMKLRKVYKYVSWFLVEVSISTLTKCISTQDVQEEHSTFQRFPCWTNHKLLWTERTWASTHYVKKLTLCRAVLQNLPPSFFFSNEQVLIMDFMLSEESEEKEEPSGTKISWFVHRPLHGILLRLIISKASYYRKIHSWSDQAIDMVSKQMKALKCWCLGGSTVYCTKFAQYAFCSNL